MSISAISQRSGAIVVHVDNPLRQDEAQRLQQQLEQPLRQGIPQVIVDMTSTPLVDGAGLEWLLDLDGQCSQAGGSVRLCGVNELCQDILLITGIGNRLEQFDTLSAALAHVM